MKKVIIFIISLTLFFLIFNSCESYKMKEYYSEKNNYVKAIGTVDHIMYNEDESRLCLGFSDLEPRFDDDSFYIAGESLNIVRRKGIDKKLKIGDKVEFISAPRYFGDGYIMPIVGISVNGEELLSFEDGYDSLLKWLD